MNVPSDLLKSKLRALAGSPVHPIGETLRRRGVVGEQRGQIVNRERRGLRRIVVLKQPEMVIVWSSSPGLDRHPATDRDR